MRLHFIAIGGSIMHQLAIAMHHKGYEVSGSDDAVFDPARTNLFNLQLLPDELGWFPQKVNENIDAVILGMHAKKDNPELLKAQLLGIPVWSYPEFIFRHAVNKKRIVIAGSHGKTTITSMVMHVLKFWDRKFDYVVGAKLPDFPDSVSLSEDTPMIVIEGDEYLASPIDTKPKFLYYHPHIALISGIAWDHINVFPTFEGYVEQFQLFVESIETGGSLVYYAGDERVAAIASNVKQATSLPYTTPAYEINNEVWQLKGGGEVVNLQVFGEHNMQNLMGAKLVCALADGITDAQFYQAIQTFTGAARRLELLATSSNCTVYKDFAHAPSKVTATTQALKAMHPNRKLIACLELHTYSSLNADFLPNYRNSLSPADLAIVFYDPDALAIKKLPAVNPEDIARCFNHPHLKVFTNPQVLQNFLLELIYQDSDLLLMSSGNFGGINLDTIAIFATQTNSTSI